MRVVRAGLACLVVTAACGKNAAPTTPPVVLPPAPSGLTAAGGAGQVALGWTAVAGATGYSLSRGTVAGGPYAETAPPAATTATDSTVAGGTTYYYVVQGVTAQGKTARSAEASALTAPDAPAGLTVTASDTSALLQWTASPGATDYLVLRAPGGSATFSQVAATTTTGAADTGLLPNTAYVYAVRAHNASGNSADATANATTAPVPPAGLIAAPSNHHVTVSWTAAPGAGSGGYRVLRSTSASGPFASVGTVSGTSFTDTFLTNNTPYYYVARTIGTSGESGNSASVSATPFIEICTLDSAAFAVNTYDGNASGNAAPKRTTGGWGTGIANATGIATDGTSLFVASQYTNSVNIYPRTVSGNTAPSSKIALPGQPTALALDTTNSELYAAAGDTVYVYNTKAAGVPSFVRQLKTGAGVNGLGLDLTHNQLFVVRANTIAIYNRTDSGTSTAPLNTILPSGGTVTTISTNTVLYGGAYDINDDTIWVVWDDGDKNPSAPTGYAASYARTTGAGTYGPYHPTSFPWVHPRGVAVDGTAEVWISNTNFTGHTQDAFYRFKRTTGVIDRGYFGSNTSLYNPTALALDSTNGEIWLVNYQNGAAAFDTTLATPTGRLNVAPVRSLDNLGAGMLEPLALAVDRVADELVVMANGPDQSLQAFPRTATSPASPSRTIAGPLNTTLSATVLADLVIDEARGEYWVDETGAASLAVFSRGQSGDVAPVRRISGPNTNINQFFGFDFDAKAGNIVKGGIDSLSNPTLMSWPSSANGNVAPSTTAIMPILAPYWLSIDLAHDLIFATSPGNGGPYVTALPRAFGNGTVAAASSFRAPIKQFAVDGEGSEIYGLTTTASGDAQIAVYASGSTGTPSPVRTVQGSATLLNRPAGLVICN